MINCRKRTINNTVAIDAGVAGGNGGKHYYTWTEEVKDEAATAKAISECNTNSDIKIRGIKRTLQEIEKQILLYENMAKEISDKSTAATTLSESFSEAQKSLDAAKVELNIKDGCSTCVQKLVAELGRMSTEVEEQKKIWDDKKIQAEKDLEEAEADQKKCADIEIKKTVTKGEWR